MEMGRLELRAPNHVIDRIDEWRLKQPGTPSRSQAIRYLIDIALDAEDAKTTRKTKPAG
jgi:metal-responsive CopG/Arc/MetJ family transcriptional regulator